MEVYNMKKQVGILVFMLVAAQMALAGRTGQEVRDFENRVKSVEISIREVTNSKDLKKDSVALKLIEMVKGDVPKLFNALKKQPELAKTLVFIEEVNQKGSSATAEEKRVAQAATDIMSVYGTAKNLTKEGQADAQAETKAVQRFAEILSNIPAYGEKAVKVAEKMADGVIRGGLSANKALRKAVSEELGLSGKELETFMKDPENGLGNCKV
jgi:hypothetical protein